MSNNISNKQNLINRFKDGDTPSGQDYKSMILSCLGVLDNINQLPEMSRDIIGQYYLIDNTIYRCELVDDTLEWTTTTLETTARERDYTNLLNKPQINKITLSKTTTLSDIGALSNNTEEYENVENISALDIALVNCNGKWVKTSVGKLRRPTLRTITISKDLWTTDGDLKRQDVSVSGVYSDSVIIATPHPNSITQYLSNQFWLENIAYNMVTIKSSKMIEEDVQMNLMIW